MNIQLAHLRKLESKGNKKLCGLHTNIDNIKHYKTPLQVFSGSPYKMFSFNYNDAQKLEKLKEDTKNKKIFIHSKYIINVSKNKDENSTIPDKINILSSKNNFSSNVIYKELKLLDKLDIKETGTVIHLSKGYNKTTKDSLLYTSNVLSSISDELLENGVSENNYIIIETSNNLSSLGSSIDDLKYIWQNLSETGKKRIRFCIDTNHIFLTGYPIDSLDGIIDYFYKFEKEIGLDKIVLFHLNDTKHEMFSKNKEHSGIGFKIFNEFSFLYDESNTKRNVIDKLKFKKFTNLNIIKSISNFFDIYVIIEDGCVTKKSENEDYVKSQIYIYNSLDYTTYSFKKIINDIYFRMIYNEFKCLRDIYRVIGDKREHNCQNIISLLANYLDYEWCSFSSCPFTIIPNPNLYSDFIDVKGFSEKTINKILYIINNKELDITRNLVNSDIYKNIMLFMDIPAIGPVTAKKILSNSIKNVDNLLKKYKHLDFLSKSQKKILSIYDKVNNKILRKDIESIEKNITKNVSGFEIYFLGSYIRNDPISSDIDILIVSDDKNNKKDFLHKLAKLYKIIHISSGDQKSLVYIQVEDKYIQLDIFLTTVDSKYESILYFTGPKEFNIWMRKIAKSKNSKLNEYGLFINNEKINVDNEKEIFIRLGMEYIPADKRSVFKNITSYDIS